MEDCIKKHFFEMCQASGVFVYVVDQDEPVYLKFTNAIKIRILIDSNVNLDTTGVYPTCEDSLDTDNRSQYGAEALDQSVNIEPAERVSQSTSSGKDSAKNFKMESETTTKGPEIDKKKPKRLKIMSPAKDQTGTDKCEQEKESSEKYHLKLRSCTGKVAKRIKDKFDINRKKRKVKALVKIKKQKRLPEQSHDKDNCSKPSALKDLPSKTLNEQTIKCKYCEVEFSNQSDFYNHRRAGESKQTCHICGKVEPYEAHLIVHMLKHKANSSSLCQSSTEMDTPTEDSKTAAGGGKKNKKVRMKCDVCDLVLSSTDSLKIHTMLHTGECPYKCCICGEKFSSLSTRQHHMDFHVSVQRFKCIPCCQRFQSRAELAKHQLTHEIKCTLCGEVFPNKTSRSCHFRVSHAGDILKCTLCSNMFASEEDLNRHMVYHKKGRKEQCPVCGVVVSKLKDHMLLHSQQACEKMFVCDQCPMSYLRKSNLDRHMRTHTGEKPYACNICTKCFRSNGMLRKHLLTHTQERPYQCEICGKRCSLRSNLNIHMRVHNADRRFPCTLCPQAFNYKNSLHGHMKSKHSKASSSHPTKQETRHPTEQIALPDLMADLDEAPPGRLVPLGLPPSLGPDLLLKPENILVPRQHDYNDMHMQLAYCANMNTASANNLILDSDRMPHLKYDILPQNNTNHDF